ncbi:MAG: NUDIX domain-containing protein [Anaerolineales bacterium]|jgi:ADP-ribose pyrophosphatase YjhB (NUDIX family)|nr:NUDIX domain-containing protein [Anaerolineales bacterium]
MKDQFTLGVFSIIFDSQKRILMAHRRDMDLWDLPGGGMEHGELPNETAIREAKEETGFDVAIDRLLVVYAKPAPWDKDLGFVFLGHVIGGEAETSDESDDVRFFGKDEMPKNISPRLRAVIDTALQNLSEIQLIRANLPHAKEWLANNQ